MLACHFYSDSTQMTGGDGTHPHPNLMEACCCEILWIMVKLPLYALWMFLVLPWSGISWPD